MVLRIGVNLGDVMVDGDDLYGDGVNIAARLEAIADPGGIMVSGTAYDHIKNKVQVGFDDLGAQWLKNIAEPVRAYRVNGTPIVTVAAPKLATDKPSMAVLPFTNMSGDPTQEYFSDGITEDIITELSRFRSLFVIARNSSFQYRAKNVDLRRVARELGVSYIVEGSVRRSGDRMRITAQLVETESLNHIWAERYDRDAHDIFAVQDELAHAIAATVGGRVDTAGRERVARLSPAGLKAHDLHLQAKAAYLKFTKTDNAMARRLASEAIASDPMNAVIKAYDALYCFVDYIMHWSDDTERSLETALKLAKEAITLDESDGTARWIITLVYMARRNFAEAYAQIKRAIELNPNDIEARGIYGNYLMYVGQPERALEQFEIVKRHDPVDLTWLPWHRGMALFTASRYEEAIEAFSQIHEPSHEIMYWLAASYTHLGRMLEAHDRLQEFLRLAQRDMTDFPGQDAQQWTNYLSRTNFYKEQRDLNRLLDGLRKVGLPLAA
jgi:TolB-like protein/Flp pilus assembly protein TadD